MHRNMIDYGSIIAFNEKARRDIHGVPTMPTPEQKDILADRVASEVQELRDSTDLVGFTDALIDTTIISLDSLCLSRIHAPSFFEIVSRANLRKAEPDGYMRLDAKGKVLKPQGWVCPEAEIALELERQTRFPMHLRPASPVDIRYVVTGRQRIERAFFGLRPVESEAFTDSMFFPEQADAEQRLEVLRQLADLLHPPMSRPAQREAALRAAYLDTRIHELSGLTVEKRTQEVVA